MAALAEESKAEADNDKPLRLKAQAVVIGGGDEAVAMALGAAEAGAQSVIVFTDSSSAPQGDLAAELEAAAAVKLLPARASYLLLNGSTGAIRAVRGALGERPVLVDCQTAALAFDTLAAANSSLLSFLSRTESGALTVDEMGRPLRNLKPGSAAPTKCGVALTKAELDDQEAPVLAPVLGLYSFPEALKFGLSSSPREFGASLAAQP